MGTHVRQPCVRWVPIKVRGKTVLSENASKRPRKRGAQHFLPHWHTAVQTKLLLLGRRKLREYWDTPLGPPVERLEEG